MNDRPIKHAVPLVCRFLLILMVCQASLLSATAQSWKQKYTKEKPLIIIGDWDKPPYEFLDSNGEPAGTNVESMEAVFQAMGVPYKYMLKDWGIALRMFERGDADIILANANRYRDGNYAISKNIITYNRICVASLGDSGRTITHDELLKEGVVLKPNDYTITYFHDMDSIYSDKVEFLSPKSALTGINDGVYKFFVWGEEPLKWKIHKLQLENHIVVNNAQIPVSDIYIIGHDAELVEAMDDQYSRLKQHGDIQVIIDKWLHPERITQKTPSTTIFIIIGALLLAGIFYLVGKFTKKRIEAMTSSSSDLNSMMLKALHMGNFDVLIYDIKRNLMTNHYGHILPDAGITMEEFIAHIHPSEQSEFRKKIDRLLNGREKKFELNKRWKVFEDDTTWLKFQGHAIMESDSEGRPAYIINAINDVTHDEEEAKKRNELAAKYKHLSNMPFFALSFYDKDGYQLQHNEMMSQLFGITDAPDALKYWEHTNIFDLLPIRNLSQRSSNHSIRACMHLKNPEIGVNHYVDYEVRPLFNAQGKLANYVCSILDVTEDRKYHMEMQRLTKERDGIQHRISLLKTHLDCLLRNSERYLLRNDISRQQISFFHSPEHPELTYQWDTLCSEHLVEADKEPFRRLLTDTKTQSSQSFTIHLAKALDGLPGTTFTVTFLPVLDGQGAIVGHTGILQDITTIDQARHHQQEVTELSENSLRMRSGFMTSMTHELLTPLNAITSFTSLLDTLSNPDERAEYVRIIRNSTDMLQRLINDLIEATSMDEGSMAIEPVNTNFASAFEDICLLLEQRTQGTGLSFIKDNPFNSFITKIDIGRIQQVLINLVANAVKFTHKGHIRVGYSYRDKGLYVYCEDTGIGIAPDKQQIIFDRFVKLDELSQGTGMGLNICKSIIEQYGGKIGVNSTGPNMGSTFWFWIPCECQEAHTVNYSS